MSKEQNKSGRLIDEATKTPRTKSEAIKYLAGMGHVACDRIEELETELAEARAEIERLKNENESLMFLVKNQRCCRNCGNHASWNFDTCGFGENPKDSNEGPECRRNDLKRWRPMEYRYAKAALAAERGE